VSQDRRTFLKRSGAALSVAAAAGCVPDTPSRPGAAGRELAGPVLDALGSVVLPGELGREGQARAVADFAGWVRDYEPVPELNHGYGTHEIRYGPADPAPGWRAQLEALDLEATKRHGAGFGEIDAADRRALVLGAVRSERGTGLPAPLQAGHVAAALMAHWFRSPDAVDRCYGRRVAPRTCRGLDGSAAEPEAVS
jgi:hypothetical protein